MDEVAGQKVAEMLPKMLLKMMGALMENGIKSWQIYDNKYSIDLRIRFDHECKAMTAGSNVVYMQGSQADTTPTHTQPVSYCRKPPSHIKRDMNRRIARAKRQRLEDSDEIENERFDESKETIFDSYTSPEIICEPPREDTLLLSPVLPISIDFGSIKCNQIDNCEEKNVCKGEPEIKLPEVGFKCPNCDEVMENASHVCNEVADATEDAISENKSETTGASSYDKMQKEENKENNVEFLRNGLRERTKERLRQLEILKKNLSCVDPP